MLKPPKARKNQQPQKPEDETLQNYQHVQTDVQGKEGERESALKEGIREKTSAQNELDHTDTNAHDEEAKSETLTEKISGETDKKAILGEDEDHIKDQGIF